MRIARGFVAMVIAVASVTAFSSPAAAEERRAQKPASVEWTTYVQYLNTLAKATTLDEIFEYLSQPQVDFFKALDNSDWPGALQTMKNAMMARGAFSGTMRLVREEREPTALYLVLEATSPGNAVLQGRVKMIREAGRTKLGSFPGEEDWHEVKKK